MTKPRNVESLFASLLGPREAKGACLRRSAARSCGTTAVLLYALPADHGAERWIAGPPEPAPELPVAERC
jgi:hypothetical protein